MTKLTHSTKTSLHDESRDFIATIKEFYPNIDEDTLDRVAKYCVVYSKGKDKKNIRQAINEWQSVFDTDLS